MDVEAFIPEVAFRKELAGFFGMMIFAVVAVFALRPFVAPNVLKY